MSTLTNCKEIYIGYWAIYPSFAKNKRFLVDAKRTLHCLELIRALLSYVLDNAIILLLVLLVVKGWNRQHHSQTIHPKEKFTSMNLSKILCVVTWA